MPTSSNPPPRGALLVAAFALLASGDNLRGQAPIPLQGQGGDPHHHGRHEPAVAPRDGLGMQPSPPQTSPLRLLDVSLGILAAVGSSTERDIDLLDLQGGEHDPRRRGFTLQQIELSLAGAVDPWFEARAHLITLLDAQTDETRVELEEAYLTTRQLPAQLQLEFGTFFTEFGRTNARHPHEWDWQDQPVVNTRLFGGDGMRGPGARLRWQVPWLAEARLSLGVQNASGETMTSFLSSDEAYAERAIGGRFFEAREVRAADDFVYALRAETAFELGETSLLGVGASALFGPNASGRDAATVVYGVDLSWRCWPDRACRHQPTLQAQAEFSGRAFDAAPQSDAADPLAPVALPGETLRDYGGYAQLLRGFAETWAVGLRVDWVSGSGASYDGSTQTFGRAFDPYRADRLRVSPLLAFRASESSRLRLQYNYDDSDHLERRAHSVWLGFEVLLGSHPSHAD